MKRVLLVEDDVGTAEVVRMVLERSYEVVSAWDGEPALQALEVERFDVVLLDLALPVLTGETLMRELHARGIRVPVIIVSVSPRLEARAAQLGAADYLCKPFDPASLEQKIEWVTGGRAR